MTGGHFFTCWQTFFRLYIRVEERCINTNGNCGLSDDLGKGADSTHPDSPLPHGSARTKKMAVKDRFWLRLRRRLGCTQQTGGLDQVRAERPPRRIRSTRHSMCLSGKLELEVCFIRLGAVCGQRSNYKHYRRRNTGLRWLKGAERLYSRKI